MLSKSTIKYVRSLRQLKYRQKYHKIVVEGVKSINDCLKDQLLNIETIYATAAWSNPLSGSSVSEAPMLISVDDHELAALSSFKTPQHVLAVCEMPDQYADPSSALSGLCLYLDGIRDPGNLGSIFRIADWFGIKSIFLSEDCVDPYNPKVTQASMGSLFRVKWSEIPIAQLLDLQGVHVFATMTEGESIYSHPLSDIGVIIMGNESTGIRNISEREGMHRIAIPHWNRLGAESLNVAVATGIICAEFRRREP